MLAACGARAQAVPAPVVAANDTWTYESTTEIGANFRQTREEVTVDHAGQGLIAVTDRTLGSNAAAHQAVTNADWSRVRSVNGKQTVVNQPFQFPLRVGKSWTTEYSEDNPNREHSNEHFRSPYKVIGWVDVTVPAGNFHALKVEAEGEWRATVGPAVAAGAVARVDRLGATTVTQTTRIGPSTASGRTYKAFWYVPEVKRWVRSVEEYYSAGGQRTSSYKAELVSYHMAG